VVRTPGTPGDEADRERAGETTAEGGGRVPRPRTVREGAPRLASPSGPLRVRGAVPTGLRLGRPFLVVRPPERGDPPGCLGRLRLEARSLDEALAWIRRRADAGARGSWWVHLSRGARTGTSWLGPSDLGERVAVVRATPGGVSVERTAPGA